MLIYVNLLGENINTIKKNTALVDTSKEVALMTEETKYIFLSHHQNAVQYH